MWANHGGPCFKFQHSGSKGSWISGNLMPFFSTLIDIRILCLKQNKQTQKADVQERPEDHEQELEKGSCEWIQSN